MGVLTLQCADNKTIQVGTQSTQRLCRHSEYFHHHLNNLMILGMDPLVVDLREMFVESDFIYCLLGMQRVPQQMNIFTLVQTAELLLVNEAYLLFVLRHLVNPYTLLRDHKWIPCLYSLLYRETCFHSLPSFLLDLVGFDIKPEKLRLFENYYEFRKFVRQAKRSDERFSVMLNRRPFKFYALSLRCKCDRCGAQQTEVWPRLRAISHSIAELRMKPPPGADIHIWCPLCTSESLKLT